MQQNRGAAARERKIARVQVFGSEGTKEGWR